MTSQQAARRASRAARPFQSVRAWTRGLENARWRTMIVAAAIFVSLGVTAGIAHVYPIAFAAVLLLLSVIAFRSTRTACVLVTLTSPLVALGSVDVGFHLLPSYLLVAAGAIGILVRREWRIVQPQLADALLLGYAILASLVSLANIGETPPGTVLGAVGVNGRDARSAAQLVALLAMVVLYVVFRVGLRTADDAAAVLRALLVAAFFVTAYAAYQVVGHALGLPYIFVNERRGSATLPLGVTYIRVNSTLSEASPLAQFALGPFMMSIAWLLLGRRARYPRWLPRYLPLVTAFAIGGLFFATLSKAGWVAFGLWLPVLLWIVLRWSPRRGIYTATGAAATVLAILVVMLVRVATSTGGSMLESERYVRVGYWDAATHIIGDHPLGIGVGNFPFYYPTYAPLSPRYEYDPAVTDAHNLFLEASAEVGVVGGLVFLSFVVVVVGSAIRSVYRSRDAFYAATVAGITVAYAAGATMHLTYSYFYYPFEWVYVALAAGAPAYLRAGGDG